MTEAEKILIEFVADCEAVGGGPHLGYHWGVCGCMARGRADMYATWRQAGRGCRDWGGDGMTCGDLAYLAVWALGVAALRWAWRTKV